MRTHILIMALFFVSSTCILAQEFVHRATDPFGIEVNTEAGIGLKYLFEDLDNDGDKDLLIAGLQIPADPGQLSLENLSYFLHVQINEGGRFNPQFSPAQDAFTNFDFPGERGFFIPAIGDLDEDGLVDLVVSAEVTIRHDQFVLFYHQDENQSFNVLRSSAYGLDSLIPNSFFVPELLDLDSDGDLDLLLCGYYPPFDDTEGNENVYLYAKNTGTGTDPAYTGWYSNPYGLRPHEGPAMLAHGDLDLDGDVDVLGVAQIGEEASIIYYENGQGPEGRPVFSTFLTAPFGLPQPNDEDIFLFPSLVDIDGDGDLDLFVPRSTDQVVYLDFFENTSCTVTTTDVDMDLCQGESYLIGDQEVTQSGSYLVSLTSSSGCDSLIAAQLRFHTIDASVSQEGNFLSSTPGQGTYQWFNCETGEDIAGAAEAIFEPAADGMYAVWIENSFGCFNLSDCLNFLRTSTEEEVLARQIRVYPNPATEVLFIDNKSGKDIDAIEVFDYAGQKRVEFQSDENNRINAAGLSPGIYFVRFRLGRFAVAKLVSIVN